MNVATTMWWFDHIFPPAMMLAAPIFTLFMSANPRDDVQRARARKLQWGLITIALISVAAYFYAYYAFGGGQWRQLWALCFMQMPILNPLLAAKNPAWVTPHAGSTRMANLDSRSTRSLVPRAAWVTAWIVWTLLLVFVIFGMNVNDLPMRLNWMIAVFVALPALCLVFAPKLVRSVSNEPEPIDPENSDILRTAYAGHRRARSWAFYGLAIVFVLVFGLCAVAVAWVGHRPQAEAAIGFYGAWTGAIAGVLGAVVGIVFGTWRTKLNQLVRELSVQRG